MWFLSLRGAERTEVQRTRKGSFQRAHHCIKSFYKTQHTASQIAKSGSITTDKNNHRYCTRRWLHFTTGNHASFFFIQNLEGISGGADGNKPVFSPRCFWPGPGHSVSHAVPQKILAEMGAGHLLCGEAGRSGLLPPLLRMPQGEA